MEYYVYIYLDSNDVPFYVGKGKCRRYYITFHLHKNNRNPFLVNKIRKIGVENVKIQFIYENLTEDEAFRQERYWIKYYGRRNNGTGTLCNLTDGGEGMSGHICSVETKRKIGKANKNRVLGPRSKEFKNKLSEAFMGRKCSEETKQKISITMIGRKYSAERKRKISDAKKGKIPWNKGKSWNEETRQKMKIAQQRRRNKERT